VHFVGLFFLQLWKCTVQKKNVCYYSGVPLDKTKPIPDGRIAGGSETTIISHPYQVRPWGCCSIWRYNKVFEQRKHPVFVMRKIKILNHIKKPDRRKRLWLCAAAEVSLTEQKKTGDSVVLFVASSTASQFHFTQAYYFKLFNSKQPNYNNFPQKG